MACANNTVDSNGNERLRIILVGKTGAGKSSLGNVLLERDTPHEEQKALDEHFAVNDGMGSGTQVCCSKTNHHTVLNRSLEVIDTPGLFDTNSKGLISPLSDFTMMLCLSVPGPHAVLFLVRCDVKFTKEEEEAFYKIQNVFDDTILKYMVIVFTHGEHLNFSIETVIKTAPESLKKILHLVDNNYTVMSKTKNMQTRTRELRNLIRIVDKVSARGTKYYTHNLLKLLLKAFKEKIDQKMKEEHISSDEASKKLKKEIQDSSGGLWLKLLLIVLGSAAFAILIDLPRSLNDFHAINPETIADLSSFLASLTIKIRATMVVKSNMCNIS